MENIRLTNGNETFLLGSILEDEIGPVHGIDSRGSGYTRCDLSGFCDHIIDPDDETPATYKIWHDDEHTETLWEVEDLSPQQVKARLIGRPATCTIGAAVQAREV